ncbi:MAG: Fic family protein [Rickettsiales bacterium]|jgi:Fic family protein|nr:Fic family protein [Rickettsiales bacterium]
MDSGKFIDTGKGYMAFSPTKLEIVGQGLRLDSLQSVIERANIAIGELRALEKMLPNPELLTERYAMKESVLSSQIEGTQSTLAEFIENEDESDVSIDVMEVRNYFNALEFGVKNIKNPNGLPLSSRLLRECHSILMKGVRGGESNKTPGEFRASQNWIGGSRPSDAKFVPPVFGEVSDLMGDLENYIHNNSQPNLVKAALMHYQFETIHPFQDGNGRIGRLLIPLFLIDRGILNSPTLYISLYLKQMQGEYYDRLMSVRTGGDYDRWVEFFLVGVVKVSEQIMTTTKNIIALEIKDRNLAKTGNEIKLLEFLLTRPIITIKEAQEKLGVTNATAGSLVKKLEGKGILVQTNKKKRYRKYAYKEYINIIDAGL